MRKTKKRFLSALLACAMIVSLFPFAAFAEGAKTAGTFDELKNAINNASDGDTIELTADIDIPAGQGNNLVIDKAITIDGKNYIIDREFNDVQKADGYGDYEEVFYVQSSGVTIKNVTISGLDQCMKDEGAIYINADGTQDAPITIDNCKFVGANTLDAASGGTGIISPYNQADYLVVKNCQFTNLKYGMYFNTISNATITGNTIDGTKYTGIFFDSSSNVTVTGNTLTNIATQNYDDVAYASGIYVANTNATGINITNNNVTLSENNTNGVAQGSVNVAQVGDTKYTSLSNAITAASQGTAPLELLSDVSIDTWNQIWNVDGLTIKGNNHTITIGSVASNGNGNYLFYGAKNLKVSDVTIQFKNSGNGFSMVSGTLDNVKMVGGNSSSYAVFVGSSSEGNNKVTVKNCTFENFDIAVYSQPAADGSKTSDLSVNGSTFNNCDMTMCSYAPNTTFTNNIVNGGSEISFAGAAENADRDNTYTITGNTFQDAGQIWFYGADLGDVTFVKNKVLGNSVVSTKDAKTETNLNVSENYWGGGAPSDDQLKGNNIVGDDEYYKAPEMDKSDLNTYYTGKYSYEINVADTDNGSVSVDKYATEGEKVTLTVSPDKAYKLDELTVTAGGKDVDLTNNGDGTYTFAMPSSNVKVSASFVEDKDYVEPDNSITVSMTIGSNDFVINNNIVTVPDAAPYIANDRTYVPFRALGEALGAKVVWNNDARTVTYTLGDTEIVMTIGDTTYTINGAEKSMDVAPEITGDRTYVPVRFVAEGLGFKVTPLYADNGTTASVVFEK